MNLANINSLRQEDIEDIEKLTVRWLFQAAKDFGNNAVEIFAKSPDDVKDIAEDVTRETLDSLAGFNVTQRVFGTVDYKKARYIILPDKAIRQALFVDSKAEKTNATATIQMSQTSMSVRQLRAGTEMDEQGLLPPISIYNGENYLTTTAFLHFKYSDDETGAHILEELTVFCIPNGLLQTNYNPNSTQTFWRAGRNAPTLGEDFRVRVSFTELQRMKAWRVQKLIYHPDGSAISGDWRE